MPSPELTHVLMVIGRVLLGGLFVVGGIRHLPIMSVISAMMQKRGVPFPRASLIAATAFEIAAGSLVVLGLFVVPAAFGLIVFTIAAGIIGLNFWDQEGDARVASINAWLTNMAVIGGLLIAAAVGS
jgi:putative oxidoreductase